MNGHLDDLPSLWKRLSGRRVAVAGDVILDEFIWGNVGRISPEAPVPVVEVARESVRLGGAANVAANLVALGADVRLVGLIGTDPAGDRFLAELSGKGISNVGIIRDAARHTTIKTRIIAHQQQVCRLDRECPESVSREILALVESAAERAVDTSEALILSDYAKGMLDAGLVGHLVARCRKASKFIAVDPKSLPFGLYRGASIITPNKKEAEAASGVRIVDRATLRKAGQILLESTGCENVLVTQGEEGMTLFSGGGVEEIPTVAREVYDVTGAGDTVIAALTLAVASGASVRLAAVVANHAAGIVVGKVGTASASLEELIASFDRHTAGPA